MFMISQYYIFQNFFIRSICWKTIGLLKPALNNSNLLGSSLTIPYFKVISKNKDFTIPTWFDNKILMAQNEHRQSNEKIKFTGFGFVNG